MVFFLVAGVLALLAIHLWQANRAIMVSPPDLLKVSEPQWTKEDLKETYRKLQAKQIDVRPYLPAKKNRRYIIVGASGLVGGWIVNHLLQRGEDPAAIRIIDMAPSKRKEALENNIDCVQADITDQEALRSAFSKPWSSHVAKLPLTVFHTAAYINPIDRHPDFTPIYVAVNINGTRNVLAAAKSAGASAFVSTSSGSVALKPIRYFPFPWERYPPGTVQILGNGTPDFTGSLSSFNSCYAWSKAQAEALVHAANSSSFHTGVIRPGHAIYGTGVENPNSLTWDYLRRGGSPSWIPNCITHFVDAQNVSIAHLAYEDALITGKSQGGKGYVVCDSKTPMKYSNLYLALSSLAHPLTPVKFPPTQHILMLLLSHVLEWYRLLYVRYLPFLPKLGSDLKYLQPATFYMCTQHLLFDHSEAMQEIGYRPAMSTKEGMVAAVIEWNEKIDNKAKADKLSNGVQKSSVVPKPPTAH